MGSSVGTNPVEISIPSVSEVHCWNPNSIHLSTAGSFPLKQSISVSEAPIGSFHMDDHWVRSVLLRFQTLPFWLANTAAEAIIAWYCGHEPEGSHLSLHGEMVWFLPQLLQPMAYGHCIVPTFSWCLCGLLDLHSVFCFPFEIPFFWSKSFISVAQGKCLDDICQWSLQWDGESPAPDSLTCSQERCVKLDQKPGKQPHFRGHPRVLLTHLHGSARPIYRPSQGFHGSQAFFHYSSWLLMSIGTLASLLLFSPYFISGPTKARKQQTAGMEETSSSNKEEEDTDIYIICSDITNTLVGISGETAPDGGNHPIYFVHSGAICPVVVLNCSWCVTPHSSPTRGCWPCWPLQSILNILNIFTIFIYIRQGIDA